MNWVQVTSFSGTGSKNGPMFSLQGGQQRIKWTCSMPQTSYTGATSYWIGSSHFSCDTDKTTGAFSSSGDSLLYLAAGSQYYFQINATPNNTWTVVLEELRPGGSAPAPPPVPTSPPGTQWVELATSSSDPARPSSCSPQSEMHCTHIPFHTDGKAQRVHWACPGSWGGRMEIQTPNGMVASQGLNAGGSGDWLLSLPAGDYKLLVATSKDPSATWAITLSDAR